MATAQEIRGACLEIATDAAFRDEPLSDLLANLAHKLGQLAERVHQLDKQQADPTGSVPPGPPGPPGPPSIV